MRRSQPWKTNRARVLRSNETSAEEQMWQALRGRRLGGLKFVRQCPIGRYFVDFVCRERRVIVEIDGATHGSDEDTARDRLRTQALVGMGFRIFRAHNTDVFENLDGVLETLLAFFDTEGASGETNPVAAPHPSPLPVKNGERE